MSLILSLTLAFAVSPDGAPPVLSAEQILEQAAQAQNADDVAKDLRDFSVRINVNRRTEGSRVVLKVERKFQAPNKLWTRIEEDAITNAIKVQGFDGEAAWIFDEKSEKVMILSGPDHRADRKQIEADLKMMRQLLRFFFLRNLIPAVDSLERLDDESVQVDRRTERVAMVIAGAGHLPETDGKPCRLKLWIDTETHYLLVARLEVEGSAPQQYHFMLHAPNEQGVVVPGNTRVYVNDSPDWSETLAIEMKKVGDVEVNDIQFNTGIDEEIFKAPDVD